LFLLESYSLFALMLGVGVAQQMQAAQISSGFTGRYSRRTIGLLLLLRRWAIRVYRLQVMLAILMVVGGSILSPRHGDGSCELSHLVSEDAPRWQDNSPIAMRQAKSTCVQPSPHLIE